MEYVKICSEFDMIVGTNPNWWQLSGKFCSELVDLGVLREAPGFSEFRLSEFQNEEILNSNAWEVWKCVKWNISRAGITDWCQREDIGLNCHIRSQAQDPCY